MPPGDVRVFKCEPTLDKKLVRRVRRVRGSLNKVTSEMKAAIAASGEIPLEYMLRIMRDEAAESARRDDMAKAAAPYLHPRLSSVEHTGDNEAFRKAVDMTDDELAAVAGRAALTLVKG